jgi:hypothetical protein
MPITQGWGIQLNESHLIFHRLVKIKGENYFFIQFCDAVHEEN